MVDRTNRLIEDFIQAFHVWEEVWLILEQLFNPLEMELAVVLSGHELNKTEILSKLNISSKELTPLLKSSYNRNLINKAQCNNVTMYSLATFEECLDTFVKFSDWSSIPKATREALDQRFLKQYIEKHEEKSKPGLLDREPANDAVLLIQEVYEMIDAARTIVVQPCDCRLLGEKCSRMIEVCLVFDAEAKILLDRQQGKKLDSKEAKSLVQKAEENGLMHTGDANWKKNGLKFVCNCCACDCFPFRGAKFLESKGVWPEIRYVVTKDTSKCNYCGVCVKRCHFEAFKKEAERIYIEGKQRNVVTFNSDLCWGCGICTSTCKPGAISMKSIK